MPVNLRPHSDQPLKILEEDYEELIKRNKGGWSHAEDDTEWLAKLHYLRAGFQAGKLENAPFLEREKRMVVDYLRKLTH